MSNKHIFFLFFHLGLGGIQRKIVDMVYHLENNKNFPNVTPHIVLRRTEPFNFESDLPDGFKQLHIENVFSSNKSKIKYLVFLTYLILEYNPKVLVPFLHHATVYCVLLKYLFFWKKIKIVVGQDNVLSLENQLPYSIKAHSNKIIGWSYRRVDAIITQTEFAKQDLIENYGVKSSRVVVIQNWVNDARLLKQSKKYDLIYCGRFAPQKRLIKLLRVVRKVKQVFPKVVLCLVGEGPEEKKLLHYIKKHRLENNVVIKSPTKEVIVELARAKIFALTSDFEGHPLVLLEAMAQELVPVTLSYPGVLEYLDNQKNGFVEESINDMAERIVELLSDSNKRKRIGKKARLTVKKNHGHDLIDKTLSVLLK